MTIRAIALYQYLLPLERPLPVGKQRIDIRRGLVLSARVDTPEGERSEQVEIAPLSGQDMDAKPLTGFSHESLEQARDTLAARLADLPGKGVDALAMLAEQSTLPSLSFGLSLLHARLTGKLDARIPARTPIPLIYQVTDEPIEKLVERIQALSPDIGSVKVKVAQASVEQELALIYRILAIRPDLKLRLDANRGFELQDAIDFSACLPLDAVEYIEEPCIRPRDNPALFQATHMPYALDESLNDPEYVFQMRPGLTALVIKPMLVGSLPKLQRLVEEAESYGVRCILSSSLEASLGIDALGALAAVLTPDETPGLDTLAAFGSDLLVATGKSRCLHLDRLQTVASYGQE